MEGQSLEESSGKDKSVNGKVCFTFFPFFFFFFGHFAFYISIISLHSEKQLLQQMDNSNLIISSNRNFCMSIFSLAKFITAGERSLIINCDIIYATTVCLILSYPQSSLYVM